MALRIIGKACPFGVPNHYNETLVAGCFKKKRRVLPMLWMHDEDRQIGEWRNFTVSDGWLWAEGICDRPEAIKQIKRGSLKELSISYQDLDATELRDYAAEYLDMDAAEEAYSATRQGRLMGNGLFLPRITKRALLDEISFVDSGAFEGTEYRWEKI